MLAKTANFRNMKDFYYQGEDLLRFQGAKRTAEEFVNNFSSDYQNLFIYGTVGTGKTFLSICVADEILKKGHSVIYFSSIGLFEMIAESTFDYKAKKSTIITSNLSLEGLQQAYQDRIFSRVTSNFKMLKLSGPDIRNQKKIAQKESEDFH